MMLREVYCLIRVCLGSSEPHFHLNSSFFKYGVMIDPSSSKLIWALVQRKNLAQLTRLYTIIYRLHLCPWLLWRLTQLSYAFMPLLQHCAPISSPSDRTPLSIQVGRSIPHFLYFSLSHGKFHKRRVQAPRIQWCLKFPHLGRKAKSPQNRDQVGALATPFHLHCHESIPTNSAKSALLGRHSSRLPSKMMIITSSLLSNF